MSEIRLICPGCEAEYRLPAGAIPPAGREVECSACGHVWTATDGAPPPVGAKRLDLADFSADPPRPAAPLPAPSSRLPPNLLNLLREEVELERRLRAADAEMPAAALASPEDGSPRISGEDEMDWPATTITGPAEDTERPAAAPSGRGAERPPQVIRHVAPTSSQTPEVEPSTTPAAAPLAARRSAGYRSGFGLAIMVAAASVALYLLAPVVADGDHPFGQHLMDLRQDVDRARLWLSDQAAAMLG